MQYEKLTAENYYHIFNRGNNKCDLFIEQENYDYFLKLLVKYILPIADVYSYALLKNHFHLLVKIKNIDDEKLISKSFSNLFNAYAKAINKKYNRTGSLFQYKFKRVKIDSDEYLKEVITYINLNPIYHQFTKEIQQYKYCSYNALICDKETLLNRKEVMELFDDKTNFIYHLKHKKLIFNEKLFLEEYIETN